MKQYFYDIYICQFDKDTDIDVLNNRISNVIDGKYINVQNLNGLSEAEKLGRINGCIMTERVRLYSESQNPVYAFIYGISEEKHIMILSVCSSILGEKNKQDILDEVFGDMSQAPLSLKGNDKNNHSESIDYWEKIFARKRLSLPRRKMPNPEMYYIDEFYVSEELTKRILATVNERKRSLKTLFYLSVGALMCKGLEASRIIIEDIHEGGHLTSIPVLLDNTSRKYDQYESVKRQLINAEYYDNCLAEEMWDKTGIDPAVTPMISTYFRYEGKYNDFLTAIEDNTVYIQKAIDAEYMNLCVIPRLSKDSFRVRYIYSDIVLEHMSIEEFHEKLSNYLEEVIFIGVGKDSINSEVSLDDKLLYENAKEKTNNTSYENENAKSSGSSYENTNVKSNDGSSDISSDSSYKKQNLGRRDKIKEACLKKISLFDNCSEPVLKKIADHTDLHSLAMDQCIIKRGENVDNLYFILKGGIEGWIQSENYYEVPVHKHFAGAVIGIESLYNDTTSNISFRSCDTETYLLSIPASLIFDIAGTNPEIIRNIIQNIGRFLESKMS